MISGLVIQKMISTAEADMIIYRIHPKTEKGANYGTTHRKHIEHGFSRLTVWSNHRTVFNNFKDSIIKLDVNLDNFMLEAGKFDPAAILASTKIIESEYNLDDSPWTVKEIIFRKEIRDPYSYKYLEYINMGNELKREKMDKQVKIYGSGSKPTSIRYDGGKKGNILYLEYQAKTGSLILELHVKAQSLKVNFTCDIDKIDPIYVENYFWFNYFNKISGSSDYFSIKKAEHIIDSEIPKSSEREKLVAILKAIAKYKGIESYLSHIKMGDVIYDDLNLFNTIQTVNIYLKKLKELNINPVIVSRRDASALKTDSIPNIMKAIGIPLDQVYKPIKVRSTSYKGNNAIDAEVHDYNESQQTITEESYGTISIKD